MKTSEILKQVLEIVEQESEISISEILSTSKTADVVDARHLCFVIMHKMGLYASRIAELFKVTPRSVQYAVSDFDTRMLVNPYLRIVYEKVANRLRNNPEILTK